MAYHSGKAAKSSAPPVITHTSLPSQTGPIVRRIVPRVPGPRRQKAATFICTPKSKPSSTK